MQILRRYKKVALPALGIIAVAGGLVLVGGMVGYFAPAVPVLGAVVAGTSGAIGPGLFVLLALSGLALVCFGVLFVATAAMAPRQGIKTSSGIRVIDDGAEIVEKNFSPELVEIIRAFNGPLKKGDIAGVKSTYDSLTKANCDRDWLSAVITIEGYAVAALKNKAFISGSPVDVRAAELRRHITPMVATNFLSF